MAQYLRFFLPVQGTWVQSLVWEDSTCPGARWAHETHLLSLCFTQEKLENCGPPRPGTTTTGPQPQREAYTPQLEKARTQ